MKYVYKVEPVAEPPLALAKAMIDRGHDPQTFKTIDIGATLVA